MAKTKATTPEPVQTIEEARQVLAALEERVLAGDMTVRAEDLAAAEDAIKLAQLQTTATDRLSALQREAQRREEAAAFKASLPARMREDELIAAREAAIEALRAYDRIVVEVYQTRQELIAEGSRLRDKQGKPGQITDGLIMGHRGIVIDGRSYTVPAPQYAIQEVSSEVTRERLAAQNRRQGERLRDQVRTIKELRAEAEAATEAENTAKREERTTIQGGRLRAPRVVNTEIVASNTLQPIYEVRGN